MQEPARPPAGADAKPSLEPARAHSEIVRSSPGRPLLPRLGSWAMAGAAALHRLTQAVFVGERLLDPPPRTPRSLLVRHLALSGVRALPLVLVVAMGSGAAIVLQSTMAPTPPSAEFGRMLVVVVLRELSPLLTALVIAGHSGTALTAELRPTELSLLTSSGTPGHVRAISGNQPMPLLWPRILATALANFVLAVYFAAAAMLSAMLVSRALTIRTLSAVQSGLEHELAVFDLPLFLVKTLGLGAIVGAFACRFAVEARRIPVEIAHGASRSFVYSLLACTVYSAGISFAVYAVVGAPPPP
jgi:phospholipid/cholesterol/gamma-HCH transport system permease protein